MSETTGGDRGFTHALADVLFRYRWVFVVPVVLPASTLFNLFWAARGFYYRRWRRAPKGHERRVREVQEQVRRWRGAGGKGLLCTSRKGWQSISTRAIRYKRRNRTVRVDLHDILGVDTQRGIVRVEPRVTVGQLTRHLNPMGWTLPVVPELEDLTVSGLILGYGVEVSSHKYGLFADLVEACEVVLGDGGLVRASREEHADLFHALPWSYGALGFIVAVELRIIPCRPCVRLTYHPARGLDEACRLLEREARRECPPEFVEGILYSRDRGVIVTGDFADRPEKGGVNAIGRWYKPWFYQHCEGFLKNGGGEECVPLRDFYRRHMRSLYWEAKLIVPFGDHPLFRLLLGWMMPPKIAFLRLTQGEAIREYYEDRHVIQDALVPMRHLRKTVEFFHGNFECYPLWLCPLRLRRTEPQGFVGPTEGAGEGEMFVDVAACYAPGPVLRGEPYNGREAVRRMEAFLIEHGGYQALYAVTEMTRQDYRRMFDCTLYDRVRAKYGAEGVFVDAYDKVKRPERD